MAFSCITPVGGLVTDWAGCCWTAGHLVTWTIILAPWFTGVSRITHRAIEALLVDGIPSVADTGHIFVALQIRGAFILWFTHVGVHVADVTLIAVQVSIVASGATSKILTSSAVEAVVMSFIAHLVETFAVGVLSADDFLTLMRVQVTFIVIWAVIVVVQAKASATRHTLCILSVAVVAMSVIRIGSISHVTLSIIVVTLCILCASAYMSKAGWMSCRAISASKPILSTTWLAFSIIAIVTEVSVMGSGDVAHSIKMFTVRIHTAIRI